MNASGFCHCLLTSPPPLSFFFFFRPRCTFRGTESVTSRIRKKKHTKKFFYLFLLSLCFGECFSLRHWQLVVASRPSPTARSNVFLVFFLYIGSTFAAPHMLKFGSSLSMLRSKIIFKKTKNKTSGTVWHVTSFPRSILSQTMALDQSAREDSLSYIVKLFSRPSLWSNLIYNFLLLFLNQLHCKYRFLDFFD